SPLLEDINLSGANGILVNVTAGLDLAIGEFEEVGRIVKEFASEDATVVVGTVIDPEMTNELRVTVVATGLGSKAARLQQKTPAVATHQPGIPSRRDAGGQRSVRVVPTVNPSRPDYSPLDTPPRFRRAVANGAPPVLDTAEEMLDIPAFLRAQAD
ncbi:MAG TPA: cell division protein FtsZ, partial [Steroidobacteraceae bacterium]|nr:cell division protein FtsZ [Steroidobacteraceae bacterium]